MSTTADVPVRTVPARHDPKPGAVMIPGDPRPPLLRVLLAARPVGWRLLFAAVLGALAIGSSVGLLATSGYLISKAALHPPLMQLGVAIAAVRAFGIGRGVFRYAERLVGHDAALRSLADLRVAVYDRLATLAPAGATLWRGGDLLSRLVSDVDAMLDLQLRVLLPYVIAILVTVGSVALVAVFVPAAAVALAIALLIGGILVPILSWRFADRTQRAVAPANGLLTAETVTLLDGAAEIIALGEQDRMLARVGEADSRLTTASRRAAGANAVSAALGILAQGGSVLAALVLGTMAVRSGTLDPVNLALVVLVPLAAYEAVLVLPAAALSLARVRAAARRIAEIVDSPDPVPDPAEPQVPDGLPAAGDLAVRKLDAGWQPGRWLVEGVDLDLRPGRCVGLVGPSGSGKSTVAAALARMAPSLGAIEFDGVDMRTLRGEDARRIVGLALQDAYLFDTSIAENVRLADRAAGDAEILAALEALGLGSWLATLPDGIDTRVGRFGRAVSGGQRQRIALARVLISRQPVVMADEPTEHLDPDTAERVMRALRRACVDRALLVVSHRDADTRDCDVLARLADGQVV